LGILSKVVISNGCRCYAIPKNYFGQAYDIFKASVFGIFKSPSFQAYLARAHKGTQTIYSSKNQGFNQTLVFFYSRYASE
jgi:hypothetical protein